MGTMKLPLTLHKLLTLLRSHTSNAGELKLSEELLEVEEPTGGSSWRSSSWASSDSDPSCLIRSKKSFESYTTSSSSEFWEPCGEAERAEGEEGSGEGLGVGALGGLGVLAGLLLCWELVLGTFFLGGADFPGWFLDLEAEDAWEACLVALGGI